LSVSKIDLSKCDRVEKKDIIRYMDSKYLSTQKYQYVYYSNSGGKLNKEVYQNFSGPIVGDKRKVVLYHSSGKNVDDITLFVIY
jgi:hypothetical protein